MATPDINALPPPEKLDILRAVQSFEAFTPEDDPHGEHDFGILDHNGARVYFKIDYYDNELHGGSEDPADPVQTTRVLTIMFAHEY